VCGILKCLYSCRWLLIFSSVVSVSEWVMLVYMFCSKLNVSFSKLEWESWKFVLVFFFFHLFHYFSLVVGVEKSLLSLANENMWNHHEFSCMGMNGPSFNCWSRRWAGDERAQSLQNWKVYSYSSLYLTRLRIEKCYMNCKYTFSESGNDSLWGCQCLLQ